ncbi:hypothetical protein [Sunxiuqinia sp. sy24]|uniref:hypothetical protein n=1 Tax=Sunxiuqinia sp. sy24 TaxID=3461495 RepID=UPI0040454F1D
MITDHFYHERIWEVGLKSFAEKLVDNKMALIFHPMHDNDSYLADLKSLPEFENGKYLNVKGVEVIPEYKVKIKW